jgi:hypothetical protein
MISDDGAWFKILPADFARGSDRFRVAGKWLCFGSQEELYSFIPWIDSLVEDGTFKAAKVAKKRRRSNSSDRKECVLCLYTSDDPAEKNAVYKKLQEIGLCPQSWKSDMETLLDLNP